MLESHFIDLLKKQSVNLRDEVNRLENLFSHEKCISGTRYLISFEQFVDEYVFRRLPFRGTYISIDEMRTGMGITINQLFDGYDCLLLFSEFLMSILTCGKKEIIKNESAVRQAATIEGNLKAIAEKTGHEWYRRAESEVILIEKNPNATQAVELIADDDTAVQIMEYNHYILRGNLVKKKAILSAIGSTLEPMLKDHTLKNGGYAALETDLGFLLNNFDIRHNNREGKTAKEYIQSLSPAELEAWYDKAYNLMLSAIIAKESISVSAELTKLKETYKW